MTATLTLAVAVSATNSHRDVYQSTDTVLALVAEIRGCYQREREMAQPQGLP